MDIAKLPTALSDWQPYRIDLSATVKGDSFWVIASKHKVNIFELVSLNSKNIFSTIYPGDELKIPQK